MSQESRQHMQVLGCRGSGKTTALRTISGYLLGSGTRRVVYVVGTRFVDSPFYVLLDAFVVGDVSSLVDWCASLPNGELLFVVDEWDVIERNGGEHAHLEKLLVEASSDHILVKRRLWCQSDKVDDYIETFHFDGPYDSAELATWIANSGLSDAPLQALDRLTGGMPACMRTRKVTSRSSVGKLRDKFIGKMKSREELAAAMKLVLRGKRHRLFSLWSNTRLWRLLCYGGNIADWIIAVRLDCDKELGLDNPARIAWNMEGLTVGVIRFRKCVFGYRFKRHSEYELGAQETVVAQLQESELLEGVLLYPAAFSEKGVHLILLRLDKQVLRIVRVEILVSDWKLTNREERRDEVLTTWIQKKRWNYQQEHYYITPDYVHLQDMVPGAICKRFVDVDDSLACFDSMLNLTRPPILKSWTRC